ncbi:MAG: hypothetical protein ACJARP_001582 [Vicingaceae bacterium]|jgi:uncharacterized protein YbbC (DUF1343 family)
MKRQVVIKKWSIFLLIFQSAFACSSAPQKTGAGEQDFTAQERELPRIILGNERMELFVSKLKDKKVGFVGNHTSLIGETHLVDSLLELDVDIIKVFSPEHGFRGTADAGEKVNNVVDSKTGLSIMSLYGSNKKPTAGQLEGVDVVLFDIQDVGVRFYTYISTLHYVMEACAEQSIPLIVLDRPNPNGHFIDGPILENAQKSFVGLHPVPVVHGMTIGEYAKMINGEKWLKNEVSCDLTVIQCENYARDMEYKITMAPSPNLPNMNSIYLYPSLCFFEGTPISIGRGTSAPFQQLGHPALKTYKYSFMPKPMAGAKNPKLNGETCYGVDLTNAKNVGARKWAKLDLSYLIDCYNQFPEKEKFFTSFFNLLAGNSSLKAAIKSGKTAPEIRKTWKEGLENYQKTREKYLIYK